MLSACSSRRRGVSRANASRGSHFLVYNSFAASALVAPHESLVDFWQRVVAGPDPRRFAAGPSLSDPRQPCPADRQRVQNLWQTLLSHLAGRFAALDNDRLDADLEPGRGDAGRLARLLGAHPPDHAAPDGHGHPRRGALCDLLSPPAAATACRIARRQRLFLVDGAPVTEEDRLQWRKLLAQQGSRGAGAAIGRSGLGELAMMALGPRQEREARGRLGGA